MLILFLIPTLALLSAVYLYQHTGKREILKFDLVQFVYAFVLAPILYVWLKSFLFVSLVQELNLHLSVTDIFIADTVYTVIFMFVYAFIIIHSLTKSFELRRSRDPFYDIFQHAEFFHLLTSHAAVYVGGGILFFILSTVNVFIPITGVYSMWGFFISILVGLSFGFMVYVGLLLTDDDFEEKYPRFEMFIELLFATFFILDILLYFYFRPQLSLERVMYWFGLTAFSGFIASSFLIERSERSVKFLQRFHYKHKTKKK